MTERTRQDLAALLDWTLAMGADAAVGEAAINWLEPGRQPPGADFEIEGLGGQSAQSRAGQAPASDLPAAAVSGTQGARGDPAGRAGPVEGSRRMATPQPPDVAVGAARAAARQARTLEELGESLKAFEGCGLKATAKSLCFYRGAAQAPLLIVGEAPGRDEDLEGRPFVGRAGQLLDRMLAAAGYGEENVHITNIVYWRPPGNRTPTPQEAEVCRPFLERQIELAAPRVVLLLGASAAKHLLRTDEGILRLRGRWSHIELGGRRIPAMASLHPAYLLRMPASKRMAWRDFLDVRQALAKPSEEAPG